MEIGLAAAFLLYVYTLVWYVSCARSSSCPISYSDSVIQTLWHRL